MKHSVLLVATATAALGLSACSKPATTTEPAPATDTVSPMATDTAMSGDAMATPSAGASDTAMASGPQKFVDTASTSDAYEIAAAKIAQNTSKTQAVKDFAALMIKDHSKSTANLKDAAAKVEGVKVDPELSAQQKSDLDTLRNTAAADFDSVYAKQQVNAHQATLSALQSYADNGDSAPLKQFAKNTIPVVQEHLKKAKALS